MNPAANVEAMRADLRRWQKKALTKGPDALFESEFIPAMVQDALRIALSTASTDEEVKAAFAAGFRGVEAAERGGWEDYP